MGNAVVGIVATRSTHRQRKIEIGTAGSDFGVTSAGGRLCYAKISHSIAMLATAVCCAWRELLTATI